MPSDSYPPQSRRPPTLLALPSYLAGSVARLGNSALVGVLKAEGLRLPQFAVLTALSDFGALPPHELASRLETDRSHISTYVEDLLTRGWVFREPDPADRRRVTVHLTDLGSERLIALTAAAAASQSDFLSALSADEQQTLCALLMKIISSAEAGGSENSERD